VQGSSGRHGPSCDTADAMARSCRAAFGLARGLAPGPPGSLSPLP